MIMGEGVRYRLGASGLIGVGLLALAALPGCTAGAAGEEPVAADSEFSEMEAPGPRVVLSDSADARSQFIVERSSPASEAVPDLAPHATVPLSPATLTDPAIDAGTDPFGRPDLELAPRTPDSNAAAVSPEERIKRLEDRFDAILAELRELKNPGLSKFPYPATDVVDPKLPKTSVKQKVRATAAPLKPQLAPAKADLYVSRPEKAGVRATKPQRPDGEPEAVSLTRTTYKLPKGIAQVVADFLTQNLNDEIEFRVKGDSLQVTASAEDQTAIAHLVRLVQTRGAIEPKPAAPLKSFKGPAPKSFDAAEVEVRSE